MRVIDVGLREGHEYRVRDTWLTVPNLITLARFALVPVFVWLTVDGRHLDAFVILAVLSGTDWVDGYVARRFDMISTVRRWLDPVADRLSLLVVAVTFVATGIAPLWLALAIAIPDVVLAAVCLWLFGGSPWSGVALALVGAGCLLHILAAGDYLVRAVGKARGLRADGQDPREEPSRRG
ncbi:CDP-alcohol phosphatidyltransferase family protein [Streptomyces sp. NPDC051172]|uniref:CDP-alcohol phosphatidyltransferase family protein n=1 Tax=Actinomycetes TaxID=1760 RepID=UPI000DFA229D|nr:CDP-alcohol phosphatidyltransferase family protein [Micrococcus luteus]STY69524.1 CDP-diacylglycerol--glycerol-3-phosphate 3-phosphatidyltransferase [Micrococcus luteus]